MRKILISLIIICLVSQMPGFRNNSMLVTEVSAEESAEPENIETLPPIVYEEEIEYDQQENETPVGESDDESMVFQNEEVNQDQPVSTEENVSVEIVEAAQESYPFNLGESDLTFVNETVTISTLEGFIKLSHCDPETIQNITINIQVSGSISTINSDKDYVEKDGTKYYFNGLGSSNYPFNGSINGNPISITVNRALFNGVTSNVNCNGNTLIWSNSEQNPKSIIAESYIFKGTAEHALNLNVAIADGTLEQPNLISGALFGEIHGINGSLKLGNFITYGSNIEVNNQQTAQNAGFICNTLTNGKILIGSDFDFPDSITVSSEYGSAGGIIGKMEDGTSLEFNSRIKSVTVNGGINSGGLVGHAVNADITGTGKLPIVSVKAKENAGGLVGYLELSKDSDLKLHGDMLTSSTITLLSDSITDSQSLANAGGLYGTFKLESGKRSLLTLTDEIAINKEASSQFATFGGLIGNLEGGETGVSIFEINGNNKTITINNSNESVSVFGGIVGQAGSHTTVFSQNNNVSINNPKANIFGGLVGYIADSGIFVLEGDNNISTSNDIVTIGDEPAAGGLVGSISEGSVLSIAGITNLSDVKYTQSQYCGQLIGKQNNALVFAKGSGNDDGDGWKYIRSSQKPKIDDIANYGQVIRLKSSAESTSGKLSHDLFVVNKDGSNAGLLSIKDYGSTGFVISSVDDFVLLAVLWQTGGSIKASNTPDYNSITSATISLSNDVDLTGTGIIGLMKDTTDNNSAFSGSFDGGNHSVKLSIGEAYGCFKDGDTFTSAAESDDGCGRIYYHDALGLFAVVNGNSSISNLTIDGKIDVETYAVKTENDKENYNCYVGGIAGLVQGGTYQISNVTVSELILCGNGTKNSMFVGGVFGALNNTTNITFGNDKNPVTSNAAIKVSKTYSGKYLCMGGLIGAVIGTNNQSELSLANVSLLKSSNNSTNLDGTSITDGQSFFAGGLIGVIAPYPSKSGSKKILNIEKVLVNEYTVESNNTSGENSISGGLLGSLWINTEVTFGNKNSSDDSYALQVVNGSNIANYVTYYGGLVYAASGKWTIDIHGIDLSGAIFSATSANSFGILVHDAYDGITPILGTNNINRGGLYIELTDHWDNVYRLKANDETKITTVVNSNASFDEFAAYTAESDIFSSERNGVISLHTNDGNGGKLVMNGTDINSYVNRSDVGQTKKTNSHSRYYYNLDKLYYEVKNGGSNGWIDTNAELMLWSVCRYGATNLKGYFTVGDVSSNASQIGGESGLMVDFDLNGYSYYPIDILNVNLTIQNASFVFYNQNIENGEKAKDNKKTSVATQHEGMHCGLFRNYLLQSSSASTFRSYELTAKNLSFSGTIGKLKNKSGVLLCGKIEGNTTNGTNIYTVSASDILLKGLRVTEIIENTDVGYAPLLIAEPSSYSTTSVSRLRTEDYNNEKSATSLIGKAGSSTATQINLSFSEMDLPSEKNSTIFTHASFLESFQYKEDGVGTAVYNFTKSDQDNNFVTFGAEIDNTKEYPGMQLWYYDESGYGTDANLVTDKIITASKDETVSYFVNKYLPYIYLPYPSGNDNKTKNCHEIEVNHRIKDITTGCGTYADPYVITDEKELETIASFLQSGAPRKNWRVTISADQESICGRRNNTSSQDTVYICDGVEWKIQSGPDNAQKTIKNEMMRYYLLSAYYDIQDDLVLNDFVGLGNKDYAFRGVVTSTNYKTITLIGKNTSHGLIPYSYGSVVKDLTISYQKNEDGGITIASSTKDTFFPFAFFGGVIGVIMGGDNIIDNVSVTMDNSFLTLNGDKAYLIQVGGYVGSISGGGVIFRNMSGKSGMNDYCLNQTGTWTPSTLENAYKSLYVNPFVGRVLDGFAFSESCTVDNTDKNYKINDIGAPERNSDGTLKSSGSIVGGTMLGNTKGGSILTIKDAYGLLAFSAILNSGASAGPASDYKGTTAYAGGTVKEYGMYQFGNVQYGKVRCAKYDKIGNPSEAAYDFKVANRDDRIAPGLQANGGTNIAANLNKADADVNLCYLAARFGDKYSMFAAVSHISDVRYIFTNNIYDMTPFGNGYQGIGCRYKANAGRNLAANTANYDRVVPWIRFVQGNGATIKASINVREYVDDDFWTMGVGAVFGYTYFRNNASLSENNSNAVSDLTILDSTLSLKYYNSGGNEDNSGYSKRKAGVGGFSGAQVGEYSIGTLKNVQIKNTTIKGGYHAGGIFGSVGKVQFSASDNVQKGHFVYTYDIKSTANFIDCGYQNLDVKGYFYSGGFVGEFSSKNDAENRIQGVICGYNGQGQSIKQSMIQSIGDITYESESMHQFSAGGLIGHYIGNTNGKLIIEGSSSIPTNILTDVNVDAYGKAAGLIGWIQNTELVVNNTTVTNTVENQTSITASNIYEPSVNYSVVGGIVGRSQDSKILLSSCKVTKMKIGSGKETAAGGLIGDSVVGSNVLETFDCGVEDCQIQTYSDTGKSCFTGGLIGFLGSTWKGANLILSGSEVTNSITSSGTNYNGLLVGRMLDSSLSSATQISSVKVAGISIQNIDPKQLSLKDVGNIDNANVSSKCYFAYAYYDNNISLNNPVISEPQVSIYETNPAYPYAVTSPVSELQVKKNENTYNLFGDGAAWTKTEKINESKTEIIFRTKAEDIFANTTGDSGLFKYGRTGVTEFDFFKRMSTYFENQKSFSSEQIPSSDFPVLQIAAGNTSVITDYLNILTNGGYSRAMGLSPNSVSAKTERYKWDGTNFVFEPGTASLRVNADGSFSVTKDYDNDMNRFTLLTVTFKETSVINGTDHEYKIHIPVIVRRVLEVDFTATLSYGVNLHSGAYENLIHHVLDSFGNTISGYLTYTYNSAYGVFSEYGWQNYINEGGNVAQVMEKTLIFNQTNPFPNGTQLTLIDEGTGKVYYKTINDSAKEISLNSFKDDYEQPFASKSIGEVLSIRVDEDNDAGKFVEVLKDDNPTVKNGKSYYRLAKTDGSEDGKKKYSVSVVEKQYSENYYIVITIPQSKSDAVNGELLTSLDGDIPHNINYKLRNQNTIDNHTNTSSTYLISEGYLQTLRETLDNSLSSTQVINATDKTIHISIESEVKFPLDQIYQDYDSLYQSFTANLQSFTSGKTDAVKFPSQTSGRVYFYIRDEENNYFSDMSNWESTTKEKTSITDYGWESTGDSMELLLSTDGSVNNLIDLQGIRDKMKASGKNKFYIEAVLEAVLPPAGIDVIPEGNLVNGNPENYARLTYVSRLSTQKDGLSYSSTKSVMSDTQIKYYREKVRENRLSYDADQIDQLGINLLDIRDEYLDQTGTSTRIETTATYDLTGITELKSLLLKSAGVRYNMKLYVKGDDLEYNSINLTDGDTYITLGPSSRQYEYNSTSGTWTWTVNNTEYLENEELKTGDFYENNAFTEKIPVWVRIDNIENADHKYSNYKLELTVDIIDSQGNALIETVSDYLIYTVTKISSEFAGN